MFCFSSWKYFIFFCPLIACIASRWIQTPPPLSLHQLSQYDINSDTSNWWFNSNIRFNKHWEVIIQLVEIKSTVKVRTTCGLILFKYIYLVCYISTLVILYNICAPLVWYCIILVFAPTDKSLRIDDIDEPPMLFIPTKFVNLDVRKLDETDSRVYAQAQSQCAHKCLLILYRKTFRNT